MKCGYWKYYFLLKLNFINISRHNLAFQNWPTRIDWGRGEGGRGEWEEDTGMRDTIVIRSKMSKVVSRNSTTTSADAAPL